MVGVGLMVYYSGELFGKTLGAVPTFIIWVVIYAVGWKWTRDPKDNTDGKAGNDDQPAGR